jgi:hypothetical protein
VEWFFFGKDVTGGEPFLFDEGVQELTVRPAGMERFEIASDKLTQRVEQQYAQRQRSVNIYTGEQYAAASATSRSVSGSKLFGWIVRLSSGDKILQMKASTPSLEMLAKKPGALPTAARQETNR